ncbi:MAG: deoxyguanosinetriphosphate triphosphohydrolase [Candidatus Omnitrophota bacterium]
MPLTQKEIKIWENKFLAPYAIKSCESRGRVYKEKEHPYRSCYQRDRDRIIHCAAFRRLEYKTQVFVNHEGDYYRTRLTHTLEVSQIGRSIARALRLNEDLVESIALAHDVGHTPFGHAGEEALAELMKDYGGFDHNTQGLRVVDYLEERYPDFPGLNLSWEVREGIVKHATVYDIVRPEPSLEPGEGTLLEMQVVDVADEIAYDNHDLDDGITSGLLKEDGLKKVALWKNVYSDVKKKYPNTPSHIRKYLIIKNLINLQVTDLVNESQKRLRAYGVKSACDARKIKTRLIDFGKNMIRLRSPLRNYLFENLYRHYRVIRMSDKARRFIEDLFGVYLAKPEQLPPTSQRRLKKENSHRVICDYIAGMTDRYALEEYKKLFDPSARV